THARGHEHNTLRLPATDLRPRPGARQARTAGACRGDGRHREPWHLRGTRHPRARAHDRALARGTCATRTGAGRSSALTPRIPCNSVRAFLRSGLIGKPPDSGSGDWRFESSLLSSRRSHRLAARTPASHGGSGGSIPPGTTSRTPWTARASHAEVLSPPTKLDTSWARR